MTAMKTFTFDVPLPPKELHPNARPHRMAKARAAKKYRATVGWAAKAALPRDWNRAALAYTLTLHYLFETNRLRDDDNLTGFFKAGRDALTEISVWPDDHLVTTGGVTWGLDARNPRVVVTVTIQDGDDSRGGLSGATFRAPA